MLFFTLAFLVKVATTTKYIYVDVPIGTSTQVMLDYSLRGLSDFYGIDYEKMDRVIECESNHDINAYVTLDVTGRAVGLLQFHDQTFNGFADQLGLVNPDIFNPFHQIEVASYMWSKKLQRHWSCYSKVS